MYNIDIDSEISLLLERIINILSDNNGEMPYKSLLKTIYSVYPNNNALYNILHRVINYKSKRLLHFIQRYPELFQIYGGKHRAKYIKYLKYDQYTDEIHSEDEYVEDTSITFDQALPYIQALFNNNLNNLNN